MTRMYRVLLLTTLGAFFLSVDGARCMAEPAPAEDKPAKEKGDPSGKKVVGDPIVAKIGNAKVIRRSEVLEAMRRMPPQAKQNMSYDKMFSLALESLIRTYLLSEHAQRSGVEKDPAFRKDFENVKSELLAQHVLILEVQSKITEADLHVRHKKLATEYPKGKEHQIWQSVVASEEEAKAVIARLDSGEDFQVVAKEKSRAPSREKGGDEGHVILSMLPPELKAPLEGLKPGEYTKTAVKIGEAFHIFKLGDPRDAVPPSFEDAKQAVASVCFQEKAMELVKRLESQKKVERFHEDGTVAPPPSEETAK